MVASIAVWAVMHHAFWGRSQIVDTPVYQRYGDAMHQGRVPFRDFGIEPRFLTHASRSSVLASLGLTAQDISRAVVETVARHDQVVSTDTTIDAPTD